MSGPNPFLFKEKQNQNTLHVVVTERSDNDAEMSLEWPGFNFYFISKEAVLKEVTPKTGIKHLRELMHFTGLFARVRGTLNNLIQSSLLGLNWSWILQLAKGYKK